jgi:hypothetical protein
MPRQINIIPADTKIVDQNGAITLFFRLAWQSLVNAFQLAATRASLAELTKGAAIGTTIAWTTAQAGVFRVSWYLRKTVADGVSSSLTITIGWTDKAAAETQAGAALAADTNVAQQNGSVVVRADANTSLTYAVAYASNTPGAMKFDVVVVVEEMA